MVMGISDYGLPRLQTAQSQVAPVVTAIKPREDQCLSFVDGRLNVPQWITDFSSD